MTKDTSGSTLLGRSVETACPPKKYSKALADPYIYRMLGHGSVLAPVVTANGADAADINTRHPVGGMVVLVTESAHAPRKKTGTESDTNTEVTVKTNVYSPDTCKEPLAPDTVK